jgi:hypothetical protein
MANYLTLADIRTAIERNTKQFTGKKGDMLDHLINMVYLSEIMMVDTLRPLFWLLQQDFTRKSVAPATITGITQANTGVFTTESAHGLTQTDVVHFYGIGGMTELNGVMAQVGEVADATHFTTNIDTSFYSAFTSGGKVYHRGITLGNNVVAHVISAGWNGYAPVMTPLTPHDMENYTEFHNEDNTAGPPQHYLFGKSMLSSGGDVNQLVWSPATDGSYLLRILYEQKVLRLAEDTDVPLLPSRFHDSIVAGVVARLVESKEQVGVEKASLWPTIYKAHLGAIKQFNQEYWTNVEQGKQVQPYML